MAQNIICPKRTHFPDGTTAISISWQLAQPARNQRERQNHGTVLQRFQGWEPFSALNTGGFNPNQLLWPSRNPCFPPGSPLACWLLLEMLLPLHTFQFPNLKHEGNYADLFSRLLWEQLRGEAIYGLDGISKLREPQNKTLIPWFSPPFTQHVSKSCPAAGKYFSARVVFCHRGM